MQFVNPHLKQIQKTVHTNFHAAPQMRVHLNVSQFYSYRRTTLRDRCVNVMEIAFGLVNANGLLKRGNLRFE